jgi:hypothetical protein
LLAVRFCAISVVAVGMMASLAARPAAAADRHPNVASALREALQIAVERGIASVGRPDGFLGNPAIRIPVPEQLARVEAKLRLAGEHRRVEKFVESLNHVAEEASPAARSVLLGAAAELAFDDGLRILAAGESAATEVLRRHALGRVITALNPAVADAMERTRVPRRYKRFVRDSPIGGLLQPSPLDLDAYVVGRTVDGIFHAVGQEERRIRTDPAARPSALLREVFATQR